MVVPVVRVTVALRDGAAASRGDGAAGGLIKKVPKGYLIRNMVFVVMVVESIDDTTITDVGSVVSAEKIGDNSRTACLKVACVMMVRGKRRVPLGIAGLGGFASF